MFKRIILPTDGSDREAAALDEAVRLARTMGIGIVTVYVLPSSDYGGGFKGVGTVLQGYEAQILQQAQAAVDRVGALGAAQRVAVEKLILRGPTAQKIAETAREGDLVVMPTKGLASVRGARLGSVTARVVEIAPCPVLVYRAPG
jgi:nucleotide-binding universal stress UspA family protein